MGLIVLASAADQAVEARSRVEKMKPKEPIHRPPTSLTNHAVVLSLY